LTIDYKRFEVLELIQEHESLLLALGILSLVCFIATLAIIPWIVVRLPVDYFAKSPRNPIISHSYPQLLRLILLLVKNLFGVIIVLLGIIMLVIPGQGLLTIMIGLILIDFPGKYVLERALIRRKPILRTVNWLRERGDKKPLEFHD